MVFKQYYLGCLAHASYLIGDEETKIAVVVDPQRDISQYLEDAKSLGLSIRHVYLTHFHADFVAGHLEIAEATGAAIHLGARAEAEYTFKSEHDGDRLEFGKVRIETLETPGHTPEGITLVVYDLAENGVVPRLALTGDTLFIGDVGRPDLMASQGVTARELGSMLYDSLHGKILRLPDATLIYPAHGAGSLCGKRLSEETVSTLGEQKRLNYALQPMSCEEFVDLVSENQPQAPQYFPFNARLNKSRRQTLDQALDRSLRPLSLEEVLAMSPPETQILDTRPENDFNSSHLRGAVSIGLGGKFAAWAGNVLNHIDPIVLIAEPGREYESEMRLGRIGYDNVAGYLEGGMSALVDRPDLLQYTHVWTAQEFFQRCRSGERFLILDVRTRGEHEDIRIRDSRNVPLQELPSRLAEIPRDLPIVVHCAGGYRSGIACSLLLRAGMDKVINLLGGIAAVEGIPDSAKELLVAGTMSRQ